MKDETPDMLLVHCVIHGEILVAKNISPVLDKVLNSVIKCINHLINAKCERLFKLFCEEQNVDHVELLLHTWVRWLSKGNCFKRFMELFNILGDFLSDKHEIEYLLTVDGKAFDKLYILNNQLQGAKKSERYLVWLLLLNYVRNMFVTIILKFHWLKQCEATDTALLVIDDHLKERLCNLKEIYFHLASCSQC